MSNTNDTNVDNCESCSSSFSIFKRKKLCSMCNQAFCQFCVTRQPRTDEQMRNGTRSSSSERICTSCKTICAPETNVEDLLKIKLKHLRAVLNSANIPTSTCKEKRDLVDLMLKNKEKFRKFHRSPPQQNTQQNNTQSQSQSTLNNTFNSIINNVQDFVGINLNSVLNPSPVPCPPPPNRTDNRTNNYNTSSSSNSSTSSNNLGSMFNFIGEQIPNGFNNTFSQFFSNQNQESRNTQGQQHHVNIPQQAQAPQTEPSSSPQQTQPSPPPPTPPPPPPHATNIKRRASISDINNESDIENLSIKQIKEILASNFVEYKGCCERKELVDKLLRLYFSHRENKRLANEINNSASGSSSKLTNETIQKTDEADLCKICMECLIDCVLLECGHMCSCIKCGKQLAECPICRQNVVRVLRVFKS